MNSIFITDSGINNVSGGGIVSKNIIESMPDLKYIFSTQKFPENKYNGIPCVPINPVDWGYERFSPFLLDYLAFNFLPREPNFDLAVTYGCPFGLTMEELKKKGTKIITDLAPHNIEITKNEHIRFFGSYKFPHLTNEVLWGLYSRHLRIADRVIVHGNKSAEYIQKQAKIREKPIAIPHGCNPPFAIPSYPNQVTPGYFGSIGVDKGISYIASAWLRTPYKEKTQMMLGGGDTKFFQLSDPNMMKYFKILGCVERLEDFYRNTSFYINASVTEGFGITPLEAMSYGRPIIVTENTPMSELITHGKEGFIIPIRDIESIVKYINYFYDNPEEIKVMGRNARETAMRYTWENIKQQYRKVFSEV